MCHTVCIYIHVHVRMQAHRRASTELSIEVSICHPLCMSTYVHVCMQAHSCPSAELSLKILYPVRKTHT